ncbi:Glutamate/aspartate transport system permease protein [Sodalis praecaptivus]|uniref:Glutamate/aspartate transport system permease protein n=1 Tax=Sodalis praecaptivus TaxID=1239307 RepID=W0HWT0_9GAMM|nr:amino acid ABC transporter permease [Sodalis praecaptivus]AHF76608.1 Glutamate/aspartate transport system permease protein [Sodalis praecaptivus]
MFDVLQIVRDNWALFLVGQYPNGPLGGLACTLLLSLCALVIAFPSSLLMAIGRISPFRLIRYPVTVWVYFMRGIPLIMVIFWTYFLVPLLIGHNISAFTTMLCTLVIYQSAYLCEVVRAGIQALPQGQMEAARALGMGYFRTTLCVILPQALYNSLPSLVSQFIAIIKETTLGYIINLQEMTFAANQVNNQLLTKPFQVFAILALTYYVLCYGLTQLTGWLERRIERKRRGGATLTSAYVPAAPRQQ